MKKFIIAAMALAMGAQAALAGVDFDGGRFDLKEEIAKLDISAPEAAAAKARPDKEWTIMVFINAKNNLERYGLKDVNEMEMVGSGDKYNVVVELARIDGFDDSEGDWTTSRRYLVQKDADTDNVTSPVVEELPKVDMGDYKHLADFARWAKAKYPAKKYMLIVWNHGAGWIKTPLRAPAKGISYDDETGNHITTPQLGQALKEIGGVDVYGSDACLMQMAEVVYELKDYATYIVGSEETEPGDGYTYDTLLGPLFAKQNMTPAELAKVAVDAYSDHYQQLGQASTQSYIKTSALASYLDASNAFAYAVTQAGDKEVARSAMSGAQSFAYPENKDVYHFAQLVAGATKSADVKAKAEALMTNIKTKLVAHNRTNSSEGGWWGPEVYDNAHGIAAYLPGGAAPAHYADLQWAKYSNWDEFIAWLAQ
ncbi:MAG: clostripain-related cysteine peptidase [Elusimicrobiales bacterium]|nr:clostripain-related cysteine peptidase [Elusimicrobiales bacterium]